MKLGAQVTRSDIIVSVFYAITRSREDVIGRDSDPSCRTTPKNYNRSYLRLKFAMVHPPSKQTNGLFFIHIELGDFANLRAKVFCYLNNLFHILRQHQKRQFSINVFVTSPHCPKNLIPNEIGTHRVCNWFNRSPVATCYGIDGALL